jgi:hypothetical protein
MAAGGIFRSSGYNSVQLQYLYYGVCIPVRVGLALLAGWLVLLGPVGALVVGGLGVAAGGYNLMLYFHREKDSHIWWDSGIQSAVGFAVGVAGTGSAAGLIKSHTGALAVTGILLGSVVFGFVQSRTVNAFG